MEHGIASRVFSQVKLGRVDGEVRASTTCSTDGQKTLAFNDWGQVWPYEYWLELVTVRDDGIKRDGRQIMRWTNVTEETVTNMAAEESDAMWRNVYLYVYCNWCGSRDTLCVRVRVLIGGGLTPNSPVHSIVIPNPLVPAVLLTPPPHSSFSTIRTLVRVFIWHIDFTDVTTETVLSHNVFLFPRSAQVVTVSTSVTRDTQCIDEMIEENK